MSGNHHDHVHFSARERVIETGARSFRYLASAVSPVESWTWSHPSTRRRTSSPFAASSPSTAVAAPPCPGSQPGAASQTPAPGFRALVEAAGVADTELLADVLR
jgi:hypothetical protein